MTINEVIEKISTIKKGTFIHIEYKANPKKLAKAKEMNIEKICNGVYRLGLNYSNLKINANKEIGSLNGKVWSKGFENYILQSEEKTMLRVYTTNVKTKAKWLLNGSKTSKEELVERNLISNAKSGFTPCFDLDIKNIISIG